jgi:hypothetical protein
MDCRATEQNRGFQASLKLLLALGNISRVIR